MGRQIRAEQSGDIWRDGALVSVDDASARANLANRVRDHLLTQLTSGELRPGDRINEAALARTLGMSRNPVREAVAAVAAHGYLTPAPNRGHFIRTFSKSDVDELFTFRIALETFALREAMEKMPLAPRRTIDAIVDRMIAHARAGRVAEVHDADVAFHRAIAEAAQNRHLSTAFASMECEVRMLIASVKAEFDPPLDAAEGHRPVSRAIVEGDADAAHAALDAHIRKTWRDVAKSLS
ncbi:MAG: GntR family transcriptional regulator [Devosia sp.]